MIAQVNAYWACLIFLAIAIGLTCASRNLAGGALYSAIVSVSSAFYIAYKTCVVNIDKDYRPRIEIHQRKAKNIHSVLEWHSRTVLREDSVSKLKVKENLDIQIFFYF